MKATIQVHYSIEIEVEVPEDYTKEQVKDFLSNEADRGTENLTRDDLAWIGTYAEDESGNEVLNLDN